MSFMSWKRVTRYVCYELNEQGDDDVADDDDADGGGDDGEQWTW